MIYSALIIQYGGVINKLLVKGLKIGLSTVFIFCECVDEGTEWVRRWKSKWVPYVFTYFHLFQLLALIQTQSVTWTPWCHETKYSKRRKTEHGQRSERQVRMMEKVIRWGQDFPQICRIPKQLVLFLSSIGCLNEKVWVVCCLFLCSIFSLPRNQAIPDQWIRMHIVSC